MLWNLILPFLIVWVYTLVVPACIAADRPSVVQSYNFLGTPLRDTLDNLRAFVRPTSGIFITGCTDTSENTETAESYVLIVPASANQGILLVLVARKKQFIIANVASLSLDRGALTIEEALGGEWTYSRLQAIANSLKDKPFRLLFDYPNAFGPLTDNECPRIE